MHMVALYATWCVLCNRRYLQMYDLPPDAITRIVGRRKDIRNHKRFAKIDTRLRLPVPRARAAGASPASGIGRCARGDGSNRERSAGRDDKRGRKRKATVR